MAVCKYDNAALLSCLSLSPKSEEKVRAWQALPILISIFIRTIAAVYMSHFVPESVSMSVKLVCPSNQYVPVCQVCPKGSGKVARASIRHASPIWIRTVFLFGFNTDAVSITHFVLMSVCKYV